MNIYEELKWRDMVKDVSDEKLANILLNKKGVKFYAGYDPTAESLTVGHLVQIIRTKFLENNGLIPYVLVGGATGLIGDPKETNERKLLDLKTSLNNAKAIQKQLSKFFDPKKVIFVNNYDWISKIDTITFLRDFGKLFNINYMLAKETVKARLEQGISYTEFSYMILQSIDFWHLFKNENVQIQFGGSDQWGNITSGLELIRKLEGPDKEVLGLSSFLLLKKDGTKFGKSESGALYLDENLTSPYELYQYFINTDDKDLLTYFKLLTLVPREEILSLLENHEQKPEARLAQERLAQEIVTFVHGEKAYKSAKNITEVLFGGDIKKLKKDELELLFRNKDIPTIELGDGLLNILTLVGISSSNREAREFIKNGAITFNGETLKDERATLTKEMLLEGKYGIIKRGKRKFALAKVK